MYIKGGNNTLADAISRLDYNPTMNRHAGDEDLDEYSSDEKWNEFITLFNHYDVKSCDTSNVNYKHNYSQAFANNLSDDKIYTVTIAEIADVQRRDPLWKSYFKEEDPRKETQNVIIEETEVLVKSQH